MADLFLLSEAQMHAVGRIVNHFVGNGAWLEPRSGDGK